MHVAQLIKSNRERCGWTQKEVADKAGVDPSFYSKIERGEKPASAGVRYAVAHELGIADEQMKICQVLDDSGIDIRKSVSRQNARLWIAFIASQNMVELDQEESDELVDLFMGPKP